MLNAAYVRENLTEEEGWGECMPRFFLVHSSISRNGGCFLFFIPGFFLWKESSQVFIMFVHNL